ncbi:MAG: hypothetical protein AB8G26_05785 [Ilumatobacter sp.]
MFSAVPAVLVVLSCVQLWLLRGIGEAMVPWILKAVIVIASATLVADPAGDVFAVAAYVVLFVVPIGAGRLVDRWAELRPGAAVWAARCGTWFHPFDRWRIKPVFYAMRQAGVSGDDATMQRLLARHPQLAPEVAFIGLDWPGVVAALTDDARIGEDPNITFLMSRGLAELEQMDSALRIWASFAREHPDPFDFTACMLCLAGRWAEPSDFWPDDQRELWAANAEQRSGDADRAAARLDHLEGSSSPRVRQLVRHRRAHPLRPMSEIEHDRGLVSELFALRRA